MSFALAASIFSAFAAPEKPIKSCGTVALERLAESPTERLLYLAERETSFVSSSEDERCPKQVQLRGTKQITLTPVAGAFAHEHNRFTYRSGLDLNRTYRERSFGLRLGLSYFVETYRETESTYAQTFSAKILSPAMIVRLWTELVFDASTDRVLYLFRGNGLEDLRCEYRRSN